MIKKTTLSHLAVLSLAAFGCSENKSSDSETVTVGFAHPFNGALATQGVTFEQAVRLALEQINANGGIHGKRLELMTRDTETNAEVAAEVTQEMLDSGMTAILEGDGTASTIAMLELTVPANVVLVAATAQTVSLARAENEGLFFRPGSTALDEAGPLAATAAADGNAKVAIISSTHPYTAGLSGVFEGAFTAEDCGEVECEVTFSGTYPVDADPETYDFSEVIDEALATQPDALLLSSYPADGKALFNAVWDAGYRGPLYTSAAAGNENLSPFLPSSQADKVKWATLGEPAGVSGDFVRELWLDSGFRAEDFFGPVHSHYDAMFLLGLAVAHAESMDGPTIAESMREVANAPGEPIHCGEWAKALRLISEGKDIDYVGVTSDIAFDDVGDNTEIITVIKGYRDGQAVVL